MPRKTPEELNEARRLKAEQQRRDEAEAAAQWEEDQRLHRELMEREQELKQQHAALENYVNGIYDEVSKLSNKRSTEAMSERMVNRSNRAIRSAQELLKAENDPFIDEIEIFIEAGDDIEARDVVLTLRQVKDALGRMKSRHDKIWNPRLY